MGLCGPVCLCMIALLWLEDCMLIRLHAFGKACVALSGVSLFSSQYEFFGELIPTAVSFTNTLSRDIFFIMCALYYTRHPLPITNIIGASCSFRLLEEGTTEKVRVPIISCTIWPIQPAQVLERLANLQERLCAALAASSIPAHILSLPAFLQPPSMPQPPTLAVLFLIPYTRALSASLCTVLMCIQSASNQYQMPMGTNGVCVCIHAGTTRAEVEALWSTRLLHGLEAS